MRANASVFLSAFLRVSIFVRSVELSVKNCAELSDMLS